MIEDIFPSQFVYPLCLSGKTQSRILILHIGGCFANNAPSTRCCSEKDGKTHRWPNLFLKNSLFIIEQSVTVLFNHYFHCFCSQQFSAPIQTATSLVDLQGVCLVSMYSLTNRRSPNLLKPTTRKCFLLFLNLQFFEF